MPRIEAVARRARLRALGAFALVLVLPTQGATVEANPIKITMTVAPTNARDITVHFKLANVSLRDLWILKEPPGVYLSLDGKDLPDRGPMVKRKPYTLDDYERVPPGHAAERSDQIADRFAFAPGTHVYLLRTAGGYYDPVTKLNVEAPPVEVRFELSR